MGVKIRKNQWVGLDGGQLEDSGCPLHFCFYSPVGWAGPKAHKEKKHSVFVAG